MKEFSYDDSGSRTFKIDISNMPALTAPAPIFNVEDSLRDAMNKVVLAHYYGWYNAQDWVGGRNCTKCSSSTGVPLIGLYNSHNVSLIDAQMSLAKKYGVTGFVTHWEGSGAGGNGAVAFENESATLLFKEAPKQGFNVTIEYGTDSLSHNQTKAKAKFVGDIDYFLSTFVDYAALMRIGGRPVIFVYTTDLYPLSFWASAISQIRAVHPDAYFIGDSYNYEDYAVFDGLNHYGTGYSDLNSSKGWTNGTTTNFLYVEIEANLHNKLWFAPAQPGFDNLNARHEVYWKTPRNNGSTYKTSWLAAINSYPNGVVITTWNEWHEGTNIEPLNTSDPMPDYWASPNQYLQITGNEAALFKGG